MFVKLIFGSNHFYQSYDQFTCYDNAMQHLKLVEFFGYIAVNFNLLMKKSIKKIISTESV